MKMVRKAFILIMLFAVLLPIMPANADSLDNIWQLKYYVDEFNDPTDEWFVTTTVVGTFSNTATTNSEVVATLVVDEQYITVLLYEYRDYPVTNTSNEDDEYTVKIKTDNGEISTYIAYLPAGGNQIIIWGDENFGDYDPTRKAYSEIVSILNAGGDVRFAISEGGNSVTKYNFSINTDGFKNEYCINATVLFDFFDLDRENLIKSFEAETGITMLFVNDGYAFVSADYGFAGEPTSRISFYFNEDGHMCRFDVNFNHSLGDKYKRILNEMTNMFGTPDYTKASNTIYEFQSDVGNYYDHKKRSEEGWVSQEYSGGYKLYSWYGDYSQWIIKQSDNSAILITLYSEYCGDVVGKNMSLDESAAITVEYYPAK